MLPILCACQSSRCRSEVQVTVLMLAIRLDSSRVVRTTRTLSYYPSTAARRFADVAAAGPDLTVPPQVLHVGRVVPVSITLKNLLEKNFAEEYAARREEEGPAPSPSDNAPIPLFVMACILPGACSTACEIQASTTAW